MAGICTNNAPVVQFSKMSIVDTACGKTLVFTDPSEGESTDTHIVALSFYEVKELKKWALNQILKEI